MDAGEATKSRGTHGGLIKVIFVLEPGAQPVAWTVPGRNVRKIAKIPQRPHFASEGQRGR
jgi:hypothetical protein